MSQPLAPKSAPRCSPSELRRLRIVGGVVLAVCLFVIGMAIAFGNAPRPFVGRMNHVLAPLVVACLALCAHALWQFRRAGREGQESNDHGTASTWA